MSSDFDEEDDSESLEEALFGRELDLSIVMTIAQEQENRVLTHLMQLLGYSGTLDQCNIDQAREIKAAYKKAMKKLVYDSVMNNTELTTGKQIADALIDAASAE